VQLKLPASRLLPGTCVPVPSANPFTVLYSMPYAMVALQGPSVTWPAQVAPSAVMPDAVPVTIAGTGSMPLPLAGTPMDGAPPPLTGMLPL
jgi:hypothetical protein